jgi:hypothetical protein
MTHPSRSLALVAGVMLALPSFAAAQASSACRPADATSDRFMRYIVQVVTRADPAYTVQRTQMALPQVSASQVSLVTDKTVCSKVLNVYKANVVNRDHATGTIIPSSGKLYVFKVGSVYTAVDPAQNLGEFSIWVTVDGRYTLLGSSMG